MMMIKNKNNNVTAYSFFVISARGANIIYTIIPYLNLKLYSYLCHDDLTHNM